MSRFGMTNSWMGEIFGDPEQLRWPLFEYEYSFDRMQVQNVFASILDWLELNDGGVDWVQVPNVVLATQGKHTPFGWNRNAKKYLIFELDVTAFGTRVRVLAAPTLSGMTEVSSRKTETRETWALLLEELWSSMGDPKSESRIALLRLRHDSSFEEGRERANAMIAVLPFPMTVALIATFVMWLLSTRAGLTYLQVPGIISMTILLILWQFLTYAVVRRVRRDKRLDEHK